MELFKDKSKIMLVLLNDGKRETSSSIDYPRFEKIFKMDKHFKHMNVSESTCSGHSCVLRPIPAMP